MVAAPALSFDLSSTLVIAVEISQSAWVIAAHLSGLEHVKVRRRIKARGEALLLALDQLKRRVPTAFEHVIITYEAGYSGFCLARRLQQQHGIKVYVIQPASVPVDRRQRRAKTDAIDADLLLRACLAPRASLVRIKDRGWAQARRMRGW